MAKSKAQVQKSSRRLQLSPSRSPLQLHEASVAADGSVKSTTLPTPVAAAGDDPSGIKAYIAFSIAYGLYPQGNGVNPEQDISDNAQTNSDVLAAIINKNALTSAKMHHLVWTLLTSDQVAKLTTVGDLMNLVKGNLSDAQQDGTGA